MNWTGKAQANWTQATMNEQTAMRQRWLVALIVSKKADTCRLLNISQDTKDQLRAAWAIYATIRAQDARRARELRIRHSYRRFVELGRLWLKYEFGVDDMAAYLDSEMSIAATVMQIEDIHNPLPEWQRKAINVCRWAQVIATSYDAPDDVRAWAADGEKIMKRYEAK